MKGDCIVLKMSWSLKGLFAMSVKCFCITITYLDVYIYSVTSICIAAWYVMEFQSYFEQGRIAARLGGGMDYSLCSHWWSLPLRLEGFDGRPARGVKLALTTWRLEHAHECPLVVSCCMLLREHSCPWAHAKNIAIVPSSCVMLHSGLFCFHSNKHSIGFEFV